MNGYRVLESSNSGEGTSCSIVVGKSLAPD